MPQFPQCAACPYDWPERACRGPKGKGPDNCPTLRERELARESLRILEADPALMEFARQASLQEADGYRITSYNVCYTKLLRTSG